MRRSSYLALTAMILLGSGFLPARTEAGATIGLGCWTGVPPTFGPPLTVGCTLDWFPAAQPAQGGTNVWWKVEFTCLTGCIVHGNPAIFTHSLLNPAADAVHKFIGANCTPLRHTLTVKSRADSVRRRHNLDVIVQSVNKTGFGNVDPTQFPPFCPFISGAVGVGVP
jgi:hypothetical protein